MARVAHQHHPTSSGEYAKIFENPREALGKGLGGERPRPDQNEDGFLTRRRWRPTEIAAIIKAHRIFGYKEADEENAVTPVCKGTLSALWLNADSAVDHRLDASHVARRSLRACRL